MDGAGSSSGDVSSTSATDEGPRADPELPQLDASPFIAVTRNLVHIVPSRARVQLGQNGMERTVIVIVIESRDGDGGDFPGQGDAGADDGFGFGFGAAVPASGVAIACLPETTVGEGEARERGKCAVCLDEYEAGDALRTMPCAHVFHERCIFGWLRLSRLCPLCRFALPPEEDTDVQYDEDDERGWR